MSTSDCILNANYSSFHVSLREQSHCVSCFQVWIVPFTLLRKKIVHLFIHEAKRDANLVATHDVDQGKLNTILGSYNE